MSAARHKFVRWNKQKEKKTDFLLCFNCCVLLMKPLKKQLIHITNSQHEQHMWLSDADIHETKVTAAASLAKYILYITCHSFWVCNLMLAIKNFCAASHGTQFYSIDALKWSFFFLLLRVLLFLWQTCVSWRNLQFQTTVCWSPRCFHVQSHNLSPIAD